MESYLKRKIKLERTSPKSKELEEIKIFLLKNCNHKWVNDLIDVTPDRSIYVKYCELCESTIKI